MTTQLMLAIDLGTSGPKVAIIDIYGQVHASHAESVPLIHTQDKGIEQDPNAWWKAIDDCAHKVIHASPQLASSIVGVATTSQWSSCVFLDRKLQLIGNSIIWMDSRGSSAIKSVNESLIKISGYHPFKLLRWITKTGGAPGHSGKDSLAHLLYIKHEKPKLFAEIYKVLEPKDYINYLLTGVIATSEETMTLYWITDNRDRKNIRYDETLLNQVGLDKSLFPEMKKSTSILGALKKGIAERWGLNKDLPVFCSTPDLQSATIGSGAVEDYAPHLCMGTSSWLTCHVPFKRTDLFRSIATLPAGIDSKYFIANEQQSAAVCLDFVRQQFLFKSPRNPSPNSFADLEQTAKSSPAGSKQVLFTPWLNGERTPVDDHTLRGGFHNMSLHHTQSDFVRSVYEGVAYNSKWLMQTVENFLKREFDSIHFIGGGAESNLWGQIHADILERQILKVKDPRYANVRGASWLGFIGLGIIKSDEIKNLVQIEATFEPKKDHFSVYRDGFDAFLSIYKQNRSLYRKLNLDHSQIH